MITNIVNNLKEGNFQAFVDAFVEGLKELFAYIYEAIGIEVEA